MTDMQSACHSLRVKLSRWNTACTPAPSEHSALYRFEFPAHEDARLVFNVARKIGNATAMTVGELMVDPESGVISGGGTFDKNWNPAPYQLYFYAKVDVRPQSTGIWQGDAVNDGAVKGSISNGCL